MESQYSISFDFTLITSDFFTMQSIPTCHALAIDIYESELIDNYIENKQLDKIGKILSGKLLIKVVEDSISDQYNKIVWQSRINNTPIAAMSHICVSEREEFFQLAISKKYAGCMFFIFPRQERLYNMPEIKGGFILVKKGSNGKLLESCYYYGIEKLQASFLFASDWYDRMGLEEIN